MAAGRGEEARLAVHHCADTPGLCSVTLVPVTCGKPGLAQAEQGRDRGPSTHYTPGATVCSLLLGVAPCVAQVGCPRRALASL